MTEIPKIPSRWRLVTNLQQGKIETLDDSHLVAPTARRSPLTPLLSGLLPNRDHNEELVRDLRVIPRNRAAAQPIFAVFAADPFIEGKQITQTLFEKGYRRIVNWPTTAQYGREFSEALDSVNLGPRQEYENLQRLADRGLSISLAVCTADRAMDVASIRPEIVFLAPTFDLWVNGKMRSSELLRRCAALARVVQGSVPIVLMTTRGAVSLTQAIDVGATGLLVA